MPCYDFACMQCKTEEPDVLVSATALAQARVCRQCGGTMERKFPLSSHTKIGATIDSRNRGSVVQEKNTKLKRMHAGYQYEEQNLRQEITKKVTEKLQ